MRESKKFSKLPNKGRTPARAKRRKNRRRKKEWLTTGVRTARFTKDIREFGRFRRRIYRKANAKARPEWKRRGLRRPEGFFPEPREFSGDRKRTLRRTRGFRRTRWTWGRANGRKRVPRKFGIRSDRQSRGRFLWPSLRPGSRQRRQPRREPTGTPVRPLGKFGRARKKIRHSRKFPKPTRLRKPRAIDGMRRTRRPVRTRRRHAVTRLPNPAGRRESRRGRPHGCGKKAFR